MDEYKYVIKVPGLNQGKNVFVTSSWEEAEHHIRLFSESGMRVIVTYLADDQSVEHKNIFDKEG